MQQSENAYLDGLRKSPPPYMDVVSVIERSGQGTTDDVLLDEALVDERIILTCDTDFLRLADERWAAGVEFAPILFWPQRQRTVGQVIRAVVQKATAHTFEQACSRVFYL